MFFLGTDKQHSWSGADSLLAAVTRREVRALLLQLPRRPAGHCHERADSRQSSRSQNGPKDTYDISAFKYRPNDWCPLSIGIPKSNSVDFSWKQLENLHLRRMSCRVSQRPRVKKEQ